jgi:hypothetical protein
MLSLIGTSHRAEDVMSRAGPMPAGFDPAGGRFGDGKVPLS